MQAIASIVRHLVVTGIALLVERFALPIEGSVIEDAGAAIALFLVTVASWAFVKFAPPALLKRLGIVAAATLLVCVTTSCTITVDPAGNWTAKPDPSSVGTISEVLIDYAK